MRSHHALLSSAVLGVIVVTTVGVSGTIHFAGPRWVPDWKNAPKQAASTLRAAPPAPTRLLIPSSHGVGMTAPREIEPLSTAARVTCARYRPGDSADPREATKLALRSLSRRYEDLTEETRTPPATPVTM